MSSAESLEAVLVTQFVATCAFARYVARQICAIKSQAWHRYVTECDSAVTKRANATPYYNNCAIRTTTYIWCYRPIALFLENCRYFHPEKVTTVYLWLRRKPFRSVQDLASHAVVIRRRLFAGFSSLLSARYLLMATAPHDWLSRIRLSQLRRIFRSNMLTCNRLSAATFSESSSKNFPHPIFFITK